jgi:hypothetical protein
VADSNNRPQQIAVNSKAPKCLRKHLFDTIEIRLCMMARGLDEEEFGPPMDSVPEICSAT